MTVEEAHKRILQRAADIANHDRRLRPMLQGIYHEQTLASNRGGLNLEIAAIDDSVLGPGERTILRQIAVDAIRQSLQENQKLLAALIISHMRAGKNYFDRF